ncbi:hypothetical protein LBMAG53_09810 [Planctomycetota bacterium]|nr:hypothetical protein LBMAG53_09810 [Planctomycetota bacterium]
MVPVDIDRVFAASPIAQALLDETWRVVRANAAWQAHFGPAATGVAWLDLVHPDDLARDLALAGRLQSGEIPDFSSVSRLLDGNGQWRSQTIAVTAISATCVLVTASDAVPPTVAPATPSEDSRTVAAALAHDVKQHARLANVYLSMLLRTTLDDRQRSQLVVASAHTERLHEVLGLLARWLRLTEDPIGISSCPLTEVWQEALRHLPADVGERLDAGSDQHLPTIQADRWLLAELLRGLVINAVRYHPGRARVHLAAVREGDGWDLVVSDDGPGIPPADRQRVVQPMQRLHTWEQVPGHGMGLALAQRIAAVHGGSLDIGAAPGGGCSVHVHLPG